MKKFFCAWNGKNSDWLNRKISVIFYSTSLLGPSALVGTWKTVTFTKFLPKMREREFPQFPSTLRVHLCKKRLFRENWKLDFTEFFRKIASPWQYCFLRENKLWVYIIHTYVDKQMYFKVKCLLGRGRRSKYRVWFTTTPPVFRNFPHVSTLSKKVDFGRKST